ncbi:hypothetical protein QN277_015211 [Acacia crassicarpa]|uniref:C2 NT-type domain-containing protein n=1 Tax=Acacia crassicarpa TaxID=499986 RepID=A0AAE1JX38_9FABA|nr:hypothetical protein QN277_015211 [Acacia crassicarpa]
MKKYWKTRLSTQTDKYEVRLNLLRLELGLFGARVRGKEAMAIEIAAKADSSNSASRFSLPFYPKSKRRCVFTSDRRPIRKSSTPSWEGRDLQDFLVVLKGDSALCEMAFHVLYEEDGSVGKAGAKMAVVGKVSMDLTVAELLDKKQTKTKSNYQLRRRLPIELRINGLVIEATLLVSGSFLKLNNSSPHDSRKTPKTSVSSPKSKQNERKIDELSPSDSEDSRWFDSDDSSKSSISTTTSTKSSGSSLSFHVPARSNPKNKLETENCFDRVQRNSSNFKGSNFRATTTRKPGTLTTKPDRGWQKKELMSRDGQAKLNTSVFFASFDQRSERASGESACSALVTVVAHWLHSNRDMPTRPEFDSLITEGSSEWRRLCKRDDASLKLFPDKHFDLDTVIEANLRPLVVNHEKSYTGFFSPNKFQSLKGAMSFDEIWQEISRDVVDCEPRIYIVSWNDHFFVLKLEADAYYIIDSLGERLFEGCQEAFILKFDDSSLMYEKAARTNSSSLSSEKEKLKLVCSGKDCCKEFFKRFLAALPLKYLEEEEKKGSIAHPYLHRLLQIEFHYSSLAMTSLFASGALEAEL